MADDEPDGIQLRGKQLVFQAMSAIVVAVGVFLLGVMVGRGVPTARQPAAVDRTGGSGSAGAVTGHSA